MYADLLKEIILYIACISPVDLRGNTIKNGHERSLIYNECKKNGFKIDEAIKSAVEQMVSSHDYISLQKDCINDEDLDRLFDYIICYLGIYNFNILPESQIEYYYSKFKEIYVCIDVEEEEEDDNEDSDDESEDDDSEYVYESDEDSDDESDDNEQPFLVSPLLRRRMNISDDECKNTKDEKEEEEEDDDDSDYVYESESDDDESDDDESDDDESDDKSDDDESDDENNFNIDTIKQYLSNGWIDKHGNQCYCIKWKGFEGYMIMLPKNFIEIRFEHDDDNYVANAFVKKYISP
jgi:hypothetical protein